MPTFRRNGGCALFEVDSSETDPTAFGVSPECVMNCRMQAMEACGVNMDDMSMDDMNMGDMMSGSVPELDDLNNLLNGLIGEMTGSRPNFNRGDRRKLNSAGAA